MILRRIGRRYRTGLSELGLESIEFALLILGITIVVFSAAMLLGGRVEAIFEGGGDLLSGVDNGYGSEVSTGGESLSLPAKIWNMFKSLWNKWFGSNDNSSSPSNITSQSDASNSQTTITSVPTSLNNQSFSIEGEGKPGENLTIILDGETIGNTTINEDGNWEYQIPADQLDYGNNTITVSDSQGSSAETSVESWWRNVSVIGQGNLADWAACVPTSTSMVMDYWHSTNSNLASPNIDTLVDSAVESYDLTPGRGMTFENATEMVSDLGYEPRSCPL